MYNLTMDGSNYGEDPNKPMPGQPHQPTIQPYPYPPHHPHHQSKSWFDCFRDNKVIVWIIVLIVIAVIAWYFFWKKPAGEVGSESGDYGSQVRVSKASNYSSKGSQYGYGGLY